MNWSALPDERARIDRQGACIADQRIALSNGEFAEHVRSAAAQLTDLGVKPGSVVAVQLQNRVELIVALFAAWRIGAAATPVNPNLTDFETAHQLKDANAAVLIGDDRPAPSFEGAYLDVAQLGASVAPETGDAYLPAPDDLALLIYTSGTTGSPKGVMLTHANLQVMCESVIEALEMTADDHCLLVLPLFHANAIVLSTLTPLLVGAHATIAVKFNIDTFFELVEKHRPTYFSAVPTIYAMLDALGKEVQPDTSSIRLAIGGAAPMPADLIERIEARYGFPLIEGYGLSEGTCASTINPLHGVRKPGTVGIPLPGQRIEIVAPDGSSQPQGATGEVAISGPNVMAGYFGKPEETAKTLANGRLHTGDVGYLDEDGYLVLVDRIKDMIIRGGENLYPKEIETALYTHPDVLEAAVIGQPDPIYGEVPVAYVALRPGSPLSTDDLFDVCRKSLSKFKLPVEIVTRENLPKNAVGKLDKPTLRAQMRARGQAANS
ncbi:class I adenylate-forming enzyme family protein [Rhodococcus spongiicola]|uniref:AMP-dependent synthetase n=1 Tax=Rhodococcus spongiicola TaxID=2487352 RepID=A0A3S3E593_9NOCA|nr:AMP-binding protein [Rhodococcus spongiicola]RVW06069.1 AMP-dependent synthetase [Rhodococcus spongiicola]